MRGLSLVAASGGHSSSRCTGLSLSWPLLLRSTGSRRAGSVVVTHGPSRSAACGIFPDQGSNLCPLHWQADSQPLRHQGSPIPIFLISFILWPSCTWSSIKDLLLCKKIIPNLVAYKKKHSGHTIPGGQVSRNSIAGWVWLGASKEIAAKLSAGAAVIWRLHWGWRISFQDSSLTQPLVWTSNQRERHWAGGEGGRGRERQRETERDREATGSSIT